jgi:hypothetical protein
MAIEKTYVPSSVCARGHFFIQTLLPLVCRRRVGGRHAMQALCAPTLCARGPLRGGW